MAEIEKKDSEFDWKNAGEIVGATKKQLLYCMTRVTGASATESARRAGYTSNTPEGLRSIASQTDKSKTVQSLLALAAAGNQGLAAEILTPGERKRIFSGMIRSGSETARVSAGRLLREIEADEIRRQEEAAPASPEAILGEIVKLLPAIRTQYSEQWVQLLAALTPAEGEALTRGAELPADTTYMDWFQKRFSGKRRANGTADTATIVDGEEAKEQTVAR